MSQRVAFQVEHGDILAREGDVLALKHADDLYGVDEIIYGRLIDIYGSPPRLPKIHGFTLHHSRGAAAATQILFVGVEPLRAFRYEQIREFGRRVLSSLAGSRAETRTLLVTVHGPGYGLDEIEAFSAQISGFVDSISSGDCPASLEKIVIVELNKGRAQRLQEALGAILPRHEVSHGPSKGSPMLGISSQRLRSAGAESAAKPAVFVAMPFAKEFEDIFYYGIDAAVRAAGYLCERADLSIFTGDILTWVQERISRASLLVADLTGANPNVYLEVGFAWGKGIPTVLLVRDTAELKFDIRGQRCLAYDSIRTLEEKLSMELEHLSPKQD